MSHLPVENRLREVVESCSVQVQQKIAASQHRHFKSSRFFCVTLYFSLMKTKFYTPAEQRVNDTVGSQAIGRINYSDE